MTDKKLSEKQELFLAALPLTKGNIREAMDLAGYAKTTTMAEVTKSLRNEIIQVAKDVLAYGAVKAASKLEEIVDNPNQLGIANALAASKEILDRSGVIKEDSREQSNPVKVTFYLPNKLGEEEVETE